MKTFNTLLCLVFLISASLVHAQSIYISELSYDPCGDQGSDSACEYIIITNNETSAVDISDYTIGNAFSYTFPAATTIPAGGSITLGISANCSVATFDLSGSWTGSMNNSGETIEIFDAAGILVSSVTYDDTFGGGDCMATCFDATGTASACASSVLAGLDCPGLGNAGDACTDANGGTSSVDGTDCTCPIACPTFGNACTDSDGDASTIDANCNCIEVGAASDFYISELSFNPCATQGADGDCEYIVITNGGASAADISDYAIANGFTYTFPAGTTIAAGGSISLGISGDCAAGTFDLSGGWSGSMANGGETIDILDASGALVSSVTYDGSFGDGNCMATCFDATGVASECESSVLGMPTFDCPTEMVNIGDDCTDSDGDASTIAADCTCTEVTPTFDCPAIMANIGDTCDDGDGTTTNDMINAACECEGLLVVANCPATAKINEFHYDNIGTDANEFIEIALPVGSDPTQVQVDLYNGSNGASNNSIILSSAEFVSTDGTFDYYVWNVAPQNGPEGIATSCIDGTQYQFITYEGAFMATDGPFTGVIGTDIGVEETNTTTTDTQSIMCDGTGTYLTNCTADPGSANDLTTCVINVLGCTDATACNYNENANIDDDSCLFATGCDVCDGSGGVIDNPEVGDLCDDGNPATNMDMILADCTCAGMVSPFDCPELEANVGAICNDANPATENDIVTDDCLCTGTPICIADFVVAEVVCDEIPGAPETYTVNIDFTNGGFDMFTIIPNAGEISGLACRCEGVVPPPPGDLVISELSFNPCTEQGNDSDCEYFIITNTGTNTIDISGYEFSNAFTFTFPDGTSIAPGQDISVGITENCPNAVFDITGGWSGTMGNTDAEILFLSDSLGTLVGTFTYDTSIADGDCMAQCFDNTGTQPVSSSCIPSVFAEPDCPVLMLSIGNP